MSETPPPPQRAGTGTAEPHDARLAAALFSMALVVGGGARILVALLELGTHHPDEIFQSLEVAHRAVYGYGIRAWEWADGARNWSFAGILAGILWVLDAVGLDHPRFYVRAFRLLFALLAVLAGIGVRQLARALGATPLSASVAGSLWLLAGPALYLAPRVSSDNACVVPLVFGLAWALGHGPRRTVFVGGLLLGLACGFRLQNLAFAGTALVVVLARRDLGRALALGAALTSMALALGSLDALTWHDAPQARFHGFFHSALTLYRYNVAEGRMAEHGTAPWHFYFACAWRSAAALVVVGVPLAVLGAWRAPALLLIALPYLGIHLWLAHKEYRFLLPAIPLVCALVGIGIDAVPRRSMPVALGLLLAATLHSDLRLRTLTYGDLGAAREGTPQHASVFDFRGGINRLMFVAYEQPDLCGLRLDDTWVVLSGAYTYLHRRVPLFQWKDEPLDAGTFNYAITRHPDSIPGGTIVARDRASALVRVPIDACTNEPGAYVHFFGERPR